MVTITTLNDINPRTIGDITIQSTPFEVTVSSGTLVIENTAVTSVNGETGDVVLDSDNISEGNSNFYYTGARFTADFNTKTTDDLSEGSTNQYYTDARVRNALSVTGDLIYNASTGEFSVTTYKSGDFDTDFAAKSTTNLSEGTNLYYTDARADARVDLQTGANLDLSQKDTDDLSEGSTNLYYTDTRADARVDLQTGANLDLSQKDTDDLSEGSNNLYYTDSRFNSDFNSKTTDDLTEGSTNQYFTNERVDDRVGNLITGGSNITVTYDDANNQMVISADTGSVGYDLSANSTDDLAEGSTNLYYTDTRADARVDLQTGANLDLSQKSTSDLSEGTNLYYTDARVQNYLTNNNYATDSDVNTAIADLVDSAPATMDTLNELAAALGDDPNFATTVSTQLGNKLNTVDFDSTADSWVATKSTDDLSEGTNLYYTDARARSAISASGDITYNSTTGEISYTTPAIPSDVSDLTDTTGLLEQDDLSNNTTSDLAEGTNLYYTDERVDDRVANLIVAGSNITVDYDDALNQLTIDVDSSLGYDLSSNTTDDLAEGSNNFYYTDARSRAALSGSGDITYNSTTGEISATTYKSSDFNTDFSAKSTDDLSEGTNLYYTDARARNSISASGDISYNSTTGEISYTTPSIPSDISDLTDSTGLLEQDDLSNNTTSDLAEGSNLYYTDARVDARIAAASVDALNDVDTTTAPPTTGEALIWDGTNFVPGTVATTTELSNDTSPVLSAELDANSNNITNVNNIEVEGTATVNILQGSGSFGVRFPNGLDLDGSGIISSHDGSFQRIPISGGLDTSITSGGSYSTTITNSSGTGRGVEVSVGTSGTDTTGGILLNAKAATTGGFAERFSVDHSGVVTINNAYSLPTSDGSSGQVLTTDGAGNLSFTTVSGASSTLDALTDVTITSPADGEGLVYDANAAVWVNGTVSGGSGINNIVEDTTPQLGGDLDVNGNNIVDNSGNGYFVIGSTGSNLSSSRTVGVALNTEFNWDGVERAYPNTQQTDVTVTQAITGGNGRLRNNFSALNIDLNGNDFTSTGAYGRGASAVYTNGVFPTNNSGTPATISQMAAFSGYYGGYVGGDNITIGDTIGLDLSASVEQYDQNLTVGNLIGVRIRGNTYDSGGVTRTGSDYSIVSDDPNSLMDHAGKIKIGAYTLPNTDGAAGYVLTTDGNGTVSWLAAGSGGTGSFDGNLAGNALFDTVDNLVNVNDPVLITSDANDSSRDYMLKINMQKNNSFGGLAASDLAHGESINSVYENVISKSYPFHNKSSYISNVHSIQDGDTTGSNPYTPTQEYGQEIRRVYYSNADSTYKHHLHYTWRFGNTGFFNTGGSTANFSNQNMDWGVPLDFQDAVVESYAFSNGAVSSFQLTNSADLMIRKHVLGYDNPVSTFKFAEDSTWSNLSYGVVDPDMDKLWGFGCNWEKTVISKIDDFMPNATVTITDTWPSNNTIQGAYGGPVNMQFANVPSWADTANRTITMTRPSAGTRFYSYKIEFFSGKLYIKDWETWDIS